jgi:hypothetical protein
MIVVEQYWQPWANLVYSLQTGKTAFEHVFGTSLWDWRLIHAEQGATYSAYLTHETLAQAGSILEALELSGVKIVADIGGGHGALLGAILRAHTHLAGVLFDLPQIVEGAEPVLKSLGVADRVTLVGGDFFAEMPVRADLYVLKSVLQGWDDMAAVVILRNCRRAMANSARLVIIERLLPERAVDDAATIMLDLHMMAVTGGRSRNLAQFETLLLDAGLALSKVTPTPSGLSIIEARPT